MKRILYDTTNFFLMGKTNYAWNAMKRILHDAINFEIFGTHGWPC